MRELKFRAWDSEEKEMNYFCPYEDACRNDGQSWNSDCIMQYTGLKDKNGKEIYEGDIVRYRTTVSYDENEKKEVIKVVRYTGGGFFPVIFMEYEFHDFDDKPLTITDVEIIGNIYENSNLIKE